MFFAQLFFGGGKQCMVQRSALIYFRFHISYFILVYVCTKCITKVRRDVVYVRDNNIY